MIVPYRLQVIAGIVALMGASAPLAQASAPSAPIEPASEIVPLYVSTSRPLAFLTIGDNPPSPVAFDTGTDENILDPAYAARLGLKVMGLSLIHISEPTRH